jgi:hypothetical protein
MNVKDLQIGDTFRILGHPTVHYDPAQLWCKVRSGLAQAVDGRTPGRRLELGFLADAAIEVVARSDGASIRRAGSTLLLKDGDVLLEHLENWDVLRCTSGKKVIEFVLRGSTFYKSRPIAVSASTAIAFQINTGASALGRPRNSTIFAYQGRVYARATNEEVMGKKTTGGYKRSILVDGSKRLVIAGLLTIPDDAALHDIIQDHFGQG